MHPNPHSLPVFLPLPLCCFSGKPDVYSQDFRKTPAIENMKSHENSNGVFFTQLHGESTISTCSVLLSHSTPFHFYGVSNLTEYISMDGCGEVLLFFTGGLLEILRYSLVAEIMSGPGGGVQYASVRAGSFWGSLRITQAFLLGKVMKSVQLVQCYSRSCNMA